MTRLPPERRLLLAVLAGGAPAVAVALVLLARGDVAGAVPVVVGAGVVLAWLVGAAAVRTRIAFWLRTATNLLAAVREGDYSFRVRGGRRDDAFGELIVELNLLAQGLREQRFGDIEATSLLRKVMAEIDVAFFAIDDTRRLRLVNRAGAQLLAGAPQPVEGRSADELGLAECLDGPASRTVALGLGGAGRFELRRGAFRQQGRPLTLLVLSDVSRTLRAEELAAWRRLIRVIGHELNNSLAPIKSLAGSLEKLAARDPLPEDFRADITGGLRVIGSRAEALNRFMSAYAAFAKMPPPVLGELDVGAWVRRVAALEGRLAVRVDEGPQTVIAADPDQLDQALINLVRNAADASLATGGGVRVAWRVGGGALEVTVEDEGPGLPDSPNVFVPFFTTKPGGSGIGLVVCRQVAENHGGTLALSNRTDRSGCRATLRLPLA